MQASKFSPAIVRREIEELSRGNSYGIALTGAFDWGLIVSVILLSESLQSTWAYLAACLIIASRQHALLVLTHEAVHYHLSRNRKANDVVSDFFFAFPILFDTNGYRQTHLKHHRHLNSDQDPDWIRKSKLPDWQFPVKMKSLSLYALTFPFWHGIKEWFQVGIHFSGVAYKEQRNSSQQRKHFAVKLTYFTTLIAMALALDGASLLLWYWIVPLFLVFPSLQRVRSVSEHFGLSHADELHATREILASPVERFFFAPHRVNHHLTHHLYPSVPFYNLPRAYQVLEREMFKGRAHLNRGYIFPFQSSVLNDLLTVELTKSTAPPAPQQMPETQAA